MTIPPIIFQWDDEANAMRPINPRQGRMHFADRERYAMVQYEGRSEVSHNHEFAWLHEAWKNLPEELTESYPTSKHLRKRALIDGGFYTETITDAGSNAAALRVAAMVRGLDEFALVIVRGPVVAVRRAKSQSKRAMGAKDFQASKQTVLEIVSAMIGVKPEELTQAAA